VSSFRVGMRVPSAAKLDEGPEEVAAAMPAAETDKLHSCQLSQWPAEPAASVTLPDLMRWQLCNERSGPDRHVHVF
jgi:hypothetical protein